MKHIYIFSLAFMFIISQSCNNRTGSSDNYLHEELQDNLAVTDHDDHEHPGEAVTEEAEQDHSDAEVTGDHEDEHAEDHVIYTLSRQSFNLVYETSGMIMVDSKDEIAITAKSHGIARYEDHFLFPGVKVQAGTVLFSITGDNLTENNTSVNFSRVEADYLEAKSNFERASVLIEERLITQESYLSVESDYRKIKAEYDAFGAASGRDGSKVKAPAEGYIEEVYITEGANVKPGDILASMIIKHNMVLKAEVAPSDRNIISEISGANFKPPYSESIYSSAELNGKWISYGISTGENSFYIPLFFRFDYTDELIPGTYTDVWLLGREREDVLLVPNSAILEEYGKFYVFVE